MHQRHNKFRGGGRYGTVTGSGWTGGTFVSKATILACRMTCRPIAGDVWYHLALGKKGKVKTIPI